MADVLNKVRSDLEKRLRELEPLVEEHAHVRRALDALKGAGTRTRQTVTAAAKRTRTSQNGTGTAARGRPRGSGARAQEALRLVHRHPGITIAEIAKRMKIKPNYLYRILPHLEKEGKVKKDGKGYHPADGSAADSEKEQDS